MHATMLPGETRQVFAVTYGEPPDPPATAAVVGILDSLAVVLRRSCQAAPHNFAPRRPVSG